MITRDEFMAAAEQLDQTVTQLALLALTFRRLGHEIWPDPKPPEPQEKLPDFNYQTGTKPDGTF